MDERVRLAFTLANGIAVQLITLSTGFLALTITFTKDLVRTPSVAGRRFLYASWASHLACILFGVWTLMALTGTVAPVDVAQQLPKDWTTFTFGSNVRLPSALQVGAFLVGMLMMVVYAATARVGARPAAERLEDIGEISRDGDFVG